jgi:hypothetical protein
MVFATKVPFVYFVLSSNNDKDQEAFKCFRDQSAYLKTLLRDYFDNFDLEMRERRNQS